MSSEKNMFFRKCDKRALIEITGAVDKIVRKYHGTGNGAVMADYCVQAAVTILATSLLCNAETKKANLLLFAEGAKNVIESYAADPTWTAPLK